MEIKGLNMIHGSGDKMGSWEHKQNNAQIITLFSLNCLEITPFCIM